MELPVGFRPLSYFGSAASNKSGVLPTSYAPSCPVWDYGEMCPMVTATAVYTGKKVLTLRKWDLGIHDKKMLCVSVFDNKFLNIGNATGATGQTYCKVCKSLINFAF